MSRALRTVALGILLSYSLPCSSVGAQSTAQATRIDWARDIEFMRLEMPRHHKNLFHSMTRPDFDAALNQLQERYPGMTDTQVSVEIMRIAAMIRDAHSGVDATPPLMRSRYLALKFYWYADGVVIQSAAPQFAALLSARLLAVDAMPVAQVMRRIAEVTDSSNAMTQRDFAPLRLSRPDLLAALGVARNPDKVVLTLQTVEKITRRVTLEPLPRGADAAPTAGGFWLYPGPAPQSDWLDAAAVARPLWLLHETETYWMQELPSDNALYVQCNFVLNDKSPESFLQFFARAIGVAQAHQYRRFVLDLRLNGGGDNTLLLPVIHEFNRAEHRIPRAQVFVLIGRRTQSAAQNFVNLLEVHTHAVFVGEPTGESPNHYGDPEAIILPSSGISISLSTTWWQDVAAGDTRDSTVPSISVALSSDDYRWGRDPVLRAALTAPRPQGITQ